MGIRALRILNFGVNGVTGVKIFGVNRYFRRKGPGRPTGDIRQKPGFLCKVYDIFDLWSKFQVQRTSGGLHFSFSVRAIFRCFSRRKPLFFGVKGLEGQPMTWGKNPDFCAKFMIFSTSGPNFKSNGGLVGSIFHFPCGQFFAVFRRRDGLGRISRRRVHRLG
jgi:hypothetical protein